MTARRRATEARTWSRARRSGGRDGAAGVGEPRARGRARWGVFVSIVIAVVVLDQLSKAWLVSTVSPGETLQVIGDYLRLVQSQNSGALFGMFRDQAVVFGLVSLGVVALIVAYHGRAGRNTYLSVALGLLLGGALGNLIDRFRLRLRRRLGRHGHRRHPVLDVQPRRLGDHRSRSSCSSVWPSSRASRNGSGPRPMPEGAVVTGPADPARARRAVGPRRPVRRRRDRAVAELRPEAHLRRTADRRRASRCGRTRSSPPAPSCASTCRRSSRSRSPAAPDIPIAVVYEDDDLLIVDKPSGLVVHPGPGHSSDTLVNALLGRAGGAEYGGIAGVARPGIVHRLDRDTSGLLMVAKHDARPGVADGPAQGPTDQEDLPGAGPGERLRRGRPDRGADRTRPEATDPDGGRARWATVGDRLPRPRAVRRLDAARAGPRDRSDAPDPRPPRRHRSPGGRRPGLRRRPRPTRSGRSRAAVPARLAARAQRPVGRSPDPGDRAAARPSSSRSSSDCGVGGSPGH